jgi:hypothetical protein
MIAAVMPWIHCPAFFLRQVHKRASLAFEFLQAGVEIRQDFLGEACADSAGEE